MALVALLNLGLVVFDLSYIPLRNSYFQQFPNFTRWYGNNFKGIEPERFTVAYLDRVEDLEEQVADTGLQSAQSNSLLQELRSLSAEMIDENPFETANKSGTLERIKNRMRDRIGIASSKEAFAVFWSYRHLSTAGWRQEIAFFNNEIRPLVETNYFRNINEAGNPTDYFWRIDVWFFCIFGTEFLVRTFYLSRRHRGVSWFDTMLWRWYDILLLIPFWRWLRVIPVMIRLYQADLLDLNPIRAQINQGVVSNFAEDITEVVIVRAINQIQAAIRQGGVIKWLAQTESQTYVDLNGINELEAIAGLLMQLIVYEVFPKVQPDIEALLRHSIERVIDQSPINQGLLNVPGLDHLQKQLTERFATETTQALHSALIASLEDPVGAKLTHRLAENFTAALGTEVQEEQRLKKIQILLADLLEEIKINYVKRLSEEDVQMVIEQTRELRQQALAERSLRGS